MLARLSACIWVASTLVFSSAPSPIVAPPDIPDRVAGPIADSLRMISNSGRRALLVAFLNDECPLSRNHVATLNELMEQFAEEATFIGLFPRYETADAALDTFRVQTDARFSLRGDPHLQWARALGASITPEVFLLDSTGRILYSGAPDDWAVSLGVHRVRATRHYVRDALTSWKSDAQILTTRTTPVGCRIE